MFGCVLRLLNHNFWICHQKLVFYLGIVIVWFGLPIWIVLVLVHSSTIVVIVIIVIAVCIISLVIHIISSPSIWPIIACYYHRFYLLKKWIYFLWKTLLHLLIVMGRLTNISVHISTLIVQNSWWYSFYFIIFVIFIIFLYSLLFIRSSPLPSWPDIRIHPSISS
jgi:hypothetical protein